MTAAPRDRDYVLGTHDAELFRLGLQHRTWRSPMLACWQRAGITLGSRVLDIGAGPGFATLDLAELVDSSGEVTAVERSARFVRAAMTACRARGFQHVRFLELDLMEDALPAGDFDAAWIRWVTCFVPSPKTLCAQLATALRPGGKVMFHEYVNYASWQLVPRSEQLDVFVQIVMKSWRDAGGEPNVAGVLPPVLAESGFRVLSATPLVYCLRPQDHMWSWLATVVRTVAERLVDLGYLDEDAAAAVRDDIAAAESSSAALMITPTVLEIVGERLAD